MLRTANAWSVAMAGLLAATTATTVAAKDPHPFSVHDMLAMQRLGSLAVAPDGTTAAFTVRTTDLKKNGGHTEIWLMQTDGSNQRQLTSHTASSHSPEWGPDSQKLYFLSSRGGDTTQVWMIPLAGGEARQVTDLPLDVQTMHVAPDGKYLAVSMEVFPDMSLDQTVGELKRRDEDPSTGQLYDQLFVRHWDTWKDGRRNHVFVLPLNGEYPLGKDAATDVMRKLDADVPSKPFGGAEDYTFTPDGKSIVFAARDVGREEAWRTRFDLFEAPIDGSHAPKVVVDGGGATLAQPTFSPDGKTLAYLAMVRPNYEADRMRIALLSWPNGKPQMLTEDWDHSAHGITWSRDSQTIFTSTDNIGNSPVFAIDAKSGKARQLFDYGGERGGIAVAADGTVLYGKHHYNSPVEFYAVAPSGGDSRQLTHFNEDQLANCKMGQPEQFSFKGWNDDTVYGWVVKPIDFDPSRKYPVAFLIHGGPQGSFGQDFHYRWNPQVYAGRGYAAIMIDFHGSTGYGEKFQDAIRGHWGDRPLEDLQKGLAAALQQYPWMDGDRVAALGASYGGYMINWIAGNWSDRFRCLVSHDGNIDERMAYFDTEELWFPEWDHEGTPWSNPEGYRKHNPIEHVDKWQTPMLIIHGGKDFRVVDTQGLSAFTALQRRGVPSRLLYFPDENHWVLKPANSIQWHETVLNWLDKWCKDEAK